MTGVAHSVMFARYNAWANRRIYASAAGFSAEALRADHGAFFGSVLGTLNHLLVADRIWMHRFTGTGPTYPALDLILHHHLADLATEREAEDARILAYTEGLSPERLAGTFSFRTIVNPQDMTHSLAAALAHFFNHQTHHRGQVHALLTGLGGRAAAPSLDLLLFQRETGVGLGG